MDQLLTPQELAEYLNMKPRTVLRKARNGDIPATRIGKQFRFDKAQIDKWLTQQMVTGQARILVVDDEPIIGLLFKNCLENEGYQVITSTNSLDALELVKKQRFDLVFLDLFMPEIDGSALFHLIRETDKKVSIAIITGYPDSDLMKKAMDMGPFLVLKKPFGNNEILEAVKGIAKLHKGTKRKHNSE